MHYNLKKGDCIYIPAYWWFQIQTITPNDLKKNASKEKVNKYNEKIKELSISVDFWY